MQAIQAAAFTLTSDFLNFLHQDSSPRCSSPAAICRVVWKHIILEVSWYWTSTLAFCAGAWLIMSPTGRQTSMEGPSEKKHLSWTKIHSWCDSKKIWWNTKTLKNTLETNKNRHRSWWLTECGSLHRGAVIWCSPEVTPKRRLKTMAKALRKSPSSCTAPESSQAENTQQKQKPKIFRSFGFRKWKKVSVKIYHYILIIYIYINLFKFLLFLEILKLGSWPFHL